MINTAFDNDLYLKIQSEKIMERIEKFGDKLYLEFGGKLFDDYHASRVLPGFQPDAKIKVLEQLKDVLEVLVVVNANDINNNKVRADNNITYTKEAERLVKSIQELGFKVNGIVLSFYQETPLILEFVASMKNKKIKVYKHYAIKGYPQNIPLVVSEEGLGKNEYVKTTKKLVVVTAPGSGSGKMATCLSQLYHDNKRKIHAGYAKYETFPIWNLDVSHPVNIAYEAATVDLQDVNMIDPFHLAAYGVNATNYNRDCESFPLLKAIFNEIYGSSPYNSPTDMGVNMAGFAITNDENARKAACDEIIRRYYSANKSYFYGKYSEESILKAQMLMNKVNVSINDRKCVQPCLDRANKNDELVLSIELNDGRVITGRENDILTAPASCILNALKEIAGLDHKLKVISPNTMNPIVQLKQHVMSEKNYKLNLDNVLTILAVQATTSPMSELVLNYCSELAHCQAHSSYLLDSGDLETLKRLKIDVTEEIVVK